MILKSPFVVFLWFMWSIHRLQNYVLEQQHLHKLKVVVLALQTQQDKDNHMYHMCTCCWNLIDGLQVGMAHV